jgi:hypothetical protein
MPSRSAPQRSFQGGHEISSDTEYGASGERPRLLEERQRHSTVGPVDTSARGNLRELCGHRGANQFAILLHPQHQRSGHGRGGNTGQQQHDDAATKRPPACGSAIALGDDQEQERQASAPNRGEWRIQARSQHDERGQCPGPTTDHGCCHPCHDWIAEASRQRPGDAVQQDVGAEAKAYRDERCGFARQTQHCNENAGERGEPQQVPE